MTFPSVAKIHPHLSWDAIKSSMAKVGIPILITSLALTGSILGIRHLGWLQGAELALYDRFIQSQPDKGKDDRLLVVGIDESDLQTLQEWPISDRTLASLLKKLETYKPRAIGLDVLRDIPIEPGRKELLKLLRQSERTVIVCKTNSQREFGVAPPPGLSLDKVGTSDLVVDPGGILRRALLWLTPPADAKLIIKKNLCNDPNNNLLSLSFNLALMYLHEQRIDPKVTPTGELKLGSTILPKFEPNMGGYRRADAEGYQLMLHYRSPDNPATQVRLTDVLNGKVSPDLIRDRIILVGYTTPQAKDDFYTPYSSNKDDLQKMPGVIVHAQSVSQILGAVLDRQPLIWVWSLPIEVAWIFGWSLVGGILAWYLRHPFWFSVAVAGGSGTIYTISLLVFLQAGWIPVVPAIATFISTAVGVVLLDRFNNSAYGQTVYKTVKTFLKLEVDIDEEKLEKQVAEITETDYFKDLQDTVKSLREQQKSPEPVAKVASETKSPTYQEENHPKLKVEEIVQSVDFFNPKSDSSKAAEDYELDFIQVLNQESKRLQTNSEPANADADAFDFIRELKQERERLKPAETPANSTQTEEPPPSYQKFTLDALFIPTEAADADLDYFDYLQHETHQLPKPQAAEEEGEMNS